MSTTFNRSYPAFPGALGNPGHIPGEALPEGLNHVGAAPSLTQRSYTRPNLPYGAGVDSESYYLQVASPEFITNAGSTFAPNLEEAVAESILRTLGRHPSVEEVQRVSGVVRACISRIDSQQALQGAFELDQRAGDPNYTRTMNTLYSLIAREVGVTAAAVVVEKLLERSPVGMVVGAVLGRSFIDDAVHDLPIQLGRAADVIRSGEYDPALDPKSSFVERQKRLARDFSSVLRQIGEFLRGLL